MQLQPITTRGNAQRRKPSTSHQRCKDPAIKKHQPPLHNANDGVQIRFTIGQIPAASSPQPTKRQAAADPKRKTIRCDKLKLLPNQRPKIKPMVMVAKVGIKLSVE